MLIIDVEVLDGKLHLFVTSCIMYIGVSLGFWSSVQDFGPVFKTLIQCLGSLSNIPLISSDGTTCIGVKEMSVAYLIVWIV